MARSVAAVLFVCLAGCGGGPAGTNPTTIVQVSGKAIARDGKPARWLTLRFYPTEPGGTSAYGVVKADGAFVPMTLSNEQGIAPGTYKVVVDPMPKGTAVSTACTSEQTTGIQVEVGPSDRELIVRLK